jgi:Ca2+-binding EF-hand superfamily protein
MFDKNKRGVITFDDFKNFAEEGEKIAQDEDDYFFKSNRFLLLSGNPSGGGGDKKSDSKKLTSFLDGDDDELDPEDLADELDLISDIPPTAVTGNADCNWLIWFLYRSACHLEPMDPESVIIDLESLCHETEMTTNEQDISIKELWNILFELKLQGNMSKTQYLKGIQVLSLHGNNRDDDRVDYSTLCKYVIRMGRSYNGLLQERRKEMEKNFHPLLIELKKYFKQLCEEGKDDKKDEIPRFEKIFRRLDNDGDGMITPKEFKIGLKKLQYKDYKAWNMLMVRRLFDECDKNKDGLLSIKEFLVYILDRQPADARGLRDSSNKNNNNNSSSNGGPLRSSDKQDRLRDLDDERNDPLQLSDDEQDEIFRKKRTLTDHELFRKVNEILMDIVPDEFPNNPQKHLEMIRSSVRRFFQRADPEYKGYVSEERFRAFLRRSGLQDRLTANELRRFTEKLKKKGTGKERYESLIDYEKLVNQLLVVTESIPKSKAEVVFTRLQDAAIASANAGRSFLNLCSLTDLHLTGFLTKEELMHTTKMMDYPMNAYDVEALCELLPNHAVTKDNRIDYRILNTILQSYSPREQFMRDLDYSNVNNSNLNNRRPNALSLSGALPSYATPGAVTNVFVDPIYGNSGVRNSNPNFISTPLGQSINSPQRGLYAGANTNSWDDLTRLNLGVGGGGGNNLPPGTPILGGGGGIGLGLNNNGAGGVYEKIIRSLAERIRYAIQDRNFQLQNNNSYTPSSSSSPIPYNIRKRMENNDLHNSGMISIRTLQYLLEELGVILTSTELQVIHSYYGKVNEPDHIFYDSFCRLIENTPVLDRNNGNNMGMNDSFSNPMAMDNSPIYFNGKVLMKYKELKEHGKELFDLFEFYDVDRKGKVRKKTHKFFL